MSTDIHIPPREAEALAYLADGLTSEQIGEKMGIAKSSVDNLIQRLFIRLGVENRVQAARWYWQRAAA